MISVTILTKNSALYLKQVLEALSQFDEVLIADSGSEDATFEIATKFSNTRIERIPFHGFGQAHNLASSLAKHDWILSIDSDEVIEPLLSQEIFELQLDPKSVYSIQRKNEYRGKWIKGCGWNPDRVLRLYNRKATAFTDAEVHESVITQGMNVIPLENAIKHYSYRSISDFLSKMQHYSDLFAKQYRNKRTASLPKAICRGLFAFVKSYFFQRGFLDGHEGFVISSYNGMTTYYKYLKLLEANQTQYQEPQIAQEIEALPPEKPCLERNR